MADHSEYKIRKIKLETDPRFKNFKEGYWISPKGTTIIKALASYEAEAINITLMNDRQQGHSSIYPIMWDWLFSEWNYLGRIK